MELSNLEKSAISCLLEEGANQLAIVKTIVGSPAQNLFFRPIMDRITDCGSNRIYNKETWQLTELAYKLLEPISLDKIRCFTKTVLENLRLEIITSGTMQSLENILQLEYECSAEKESLIKETFKYSKQLNTLSSQIKQVASKSFEDINNKEIQLAKLQDEMLDLQYHKEVSSVFMEQWVGARLSQVSQWLRDHEHKLVQSIEYSVVACDLQDRVHLELLNYLHCLIHDLREQLEFWEERTKTETAEMNLKLERLQQARSEQSLQLQALASLFKQHNDEIKSYIEERTARERKEEMEQHINRMATKIQAWWRGTMVRRHLGPYKADKKKKQKDKPKKKK